MRYIALLWMFAVCAICLQWTRVAGTVKAIDLKDQTVTIQDRDGDLLVVPVDYQVKIRERHGELRGLAQLQLDEKIVLTRVISDKPVPDDGATEPPEDHPSAL